MYFVPFSIIYLFWVIKPLKRFTISIISIYLVTLDVLTDILVIFYWIFRGDYIWAIIQIMFILIGQIFGAFSSYIVHEDKEISSVSLTRVDKIMSFLGFGRAWFSIKSWSDTSKQQKYRKFYRKHKIFELMYESFPTVTLQLYVSLVSDQYSSTIFRSILFSFLSMSYSVILYLSAITRNNSIGDNNQDVEDKAMNNDMNVTNIELATTSKERGDTKIDPAKEDNHGQNKTLTSNPMTNNQQAIWSDLEDEQSPL